MEKSKKQKINFVNPTKKGARFATDNIGWLFGDLTNYTIGNIIAIGSRLVIRALIGLHRLL